MRFQGKVTNWNDNKGYGFVEPNGGGDRSFVHIKSFVKNYPRPSNGDIITYEKIKGRDGRYKASEIRLVNNTNKQGKKSIRSQNLGVNLTIGFCVLIVMVTILGKLPYQISVIYFIASILAFLVYAFDKSAAQNNRWRTKESTLHIISIIGGWPGAYYAQNKLRHKSSKAEFKRTFLVTVLINLGVFIWLFTENGSNFINAVVRV